MRIASVGAPRHFHLLWDDDIELLRDILQAITERSEEIVRHWYRLYVLHFGDERSLSESEFTRIFEPGLRRNKMALLAGDMDAYAQQVIHLGETLAERRVPLEEVIASLHLFEESAQTVFPADAATHLYTSFDKLSHVRIILMVSAYFRSHSASAGERIAALEREAARLNHDHRTRFHGLVGGSPAMRRVYNRIEALGATDAEVLVAGEKGTGKELVARAIHEIGAGNQGSFIAANCGAIPPALIEGELFGYKREASGDTPADYLGLFRAAHGGTLFVDEITALSPQMQAEIVRVLRERTVRPAGTAEQYPIKLRVIASTRRNPQTAVNEGRLDPEFFKRVRNSTIEVPPLRDRMEDIAPLVEHFISVFRERSGHPIYGISEDALEALRALDWPSNVRELGEAVEAAFTTGAEHTIRREDLPIGFEEGDEQAVAAGSRNAAQPRLGSFAELERDLIARALDSTGGNKVQTARLLKISRKKLYARIRKFGLE